MVITLIFCILIVFLNHCIRRRNYNLLRGEGWGNTRSRKF